MTIEQKMTLNHHSAGVLPYHWTNSGELYFVLEQKDPGFMNPYFNNGLNFLGGNWESKSQKHAEDRSPEGTLKRELEEEFFLRGEDPESLAALIGGDVLEKKPNLLAKHDAKGLEKIRYMGRMLSEATPKYEGDFIMTINPPIRKAALTYGSTIFSHELDAYEFAVINATLNHFGGVISTDNMKWGSKTVAVSLGDIIKEQRRFAWGYDQVLKGLTPKASKDGSIATVDGIVLKDMWAQPSLVRLSVDDVLDPTKTGCSTYKELQERFNYLK